MYAVPKFVHIHAFNSQEALAKYAGLVWRENQSGNFQADDTPLSKAGNTYLRYYLIEATSHDIRLARYMADTLLVLKQGHLIEYGKASSVIGNPQQPYTKELLFLAGIRKDF